MTITNGYATLIELKSRLYTPGTVDALEDTVMENVIEAVSRLIDIHCGRRFWKNGIAEARYYTAKYYDVLYPDDIVSITSLKTDNDGDRTYEITWATTDYDLEPYNAALYYPVMPYTKISLTPQGRYSFPTHKKGIELTGIFGWSTIPDLANEACLLQSEIMFKRKDAIFGVSGSPSLGELSANYPLDPHVKMLLDPLVKLPLLVIE